MPIQVKHSTSGTGAGATGISRGIDKNRQYRTQQQQLALQQQQQAMQQRRLNLYKQRLVKQDKMDERAAEIKARQMEAAARQAEQDFQLRLQQQQSAEKTSQQQLELQQQHIDQAPAMAEYENDLAIQRDAARYTARQKAEINKLQDSLNRVDMMEQSGELSPQAAEHFRERTIAKINGISPPKFNVEEDEPTPEERFMKTSYEDENGDIWVETTNGWNNTTQEAHQQYQKMKQEFIGETTKDLMSQTYKTFEKSGGQHVPVEKPLYSPREASSRAIDLWESMGFKESNQNKQQQSSPELDPWAPPRDLLAKEEGKSQRVNASTEPSMSEKTQPIEEEQPQPPEQSRQKPSPGEMMGVGQPNSVPSMNKVKEKEKSLPKLPEGVTPPPEFENPQQVSQLRSMPEDEQIDNLSLIAIRELGAMASDKELQQYLEQLKKAL